MRIDRVRARRRTAFERWMQVRHDPLASGTVVRLAFEWMVAWDRAYHKEIMGL